MVSVDAGDAASGFVPLAPRTVSSSRAEASGVAICDVEGPEVPLGESEVGGEGGTGSRPPRRPESEPKPLRAIVAAPPNKKISNIPKPTATTRDRLPLLLGAIGGG